MMIIRIFCLSLAILFSTAADPPATPAAKCKVPADIAILVDASQSVELGGRIAGIPNYFKTVMIEGLKTIVNSFEVSPKDTRFSLMLFGDKVPILVFDFDKFKTAAEMIAAIDQLPTKNFIDTYTGVAFQKAKAEFFDKATKRDDNAANIIVVITDGDPTDAAIADATAEEIKKAGIRVMPVAVGNGVSDANLKKWASDPAFNLRAQFKTLASEVLKVSDVVCKASKQAHAECPAKFNGASYCWTFESENRLRQTSESIKKRIGTLNTKAKISQTSSHGMVLDLTTTGASADLGNYAGECLTDPNKCAGGITVMFWIKLTSAYINANIQAGNTHQYIISTGGQRRDSRGFAFLYQKDAQFTGFKLQLQTSTADYVIQLNSIPETWFAFAFTFKEGAGANDGLIYYQNGARMEKGTKIPGTYAKDTVTKMTLGKPNKGEQFFGSYLMNNLVIWYQALSSDQIFTIINDKPPPPQPPQPPPAIAGDDAAGKCGPGYNDAKFCYPFDTMYKTAAGDITPEVISSQKNAILKAGAVISTAAPRGKFLSLVTTLKSWVNVGDFKGECTSDLTLCTNGISVMFWLRIQPNDIDRNGEKHQYIISSGGQVSSSRGFAFLYAKEESKFKLQLQTTTGVYRTALTNIPENWFHFAFTFKEGVGLTYFQDGKMVAQVKGEAASYATDTYTSLTIGKPNHKESLFGTFQMDHLVIFYKTVTQEDLKTILQVAVTTQAPVTTAAPGQSTPALAPEVTLAEPGVTTAAPGVTTPAPGVTTPAPGVTTVAPVAPPMPPELTTVAPSAVPPPIPPEITTKPGQTPLVTTPKPVTTKAPIVTQTATTVAPKPTVPGGKCNARVDVAIVIDNSGSIEAKNRDGFFSRVKTFAKHVYRSFQVGGNADIAVVEAGTDPKIIFNFGKYKDVLSMDSAVNQIEHKKQRSFLGKTLDVVRSDVMTKVICKKSLKAVVVITDGYSSDDVTLPSIELRDMGVTVISVGFGDETPYMKYALEAMASDPKDQHRLIFDYGDVMEGVSQVTAVICQAAGEVESPNSIDESTPITEEVSLSFKMLFLDEANKYRRMHSAVPLVWSYGLMTKAQQWAEFLAKEKKVQHMSKVKYGQALFAANVTGTSISQISVRSWYNQIINYDFQRPKINSGNRYFVQLVWRGTTEVGVGKFTAPGTPSMTYIVAFFNPAGDSEDGIQYNVLPVTGTAVQGASPGSCPEGFQSNGAYCYKLFTEQKTWVKAVETCNEMKASLVSVARDEEHYYLTQLLQTNTVPQAWIGLNDRQTEGSFTWVDGMPLSFNGWQTAPTSSGQKDCVQFNAQKGWMDNNCEIIQPFICKALRPGDVIFMVTLHYPTEPWSADLVYGSSAAAVEIIQRVERFIMNIYGTKEWFLSFTIKDFRGHVSVLIDIEMRFAPGAPIDPLVPLKNVTYTEECEGFICDLIDIQIIPDLMTALQILSRIVKLNSSVMDLWT